MPNTFSIRKQLHLPATPEVVWNAVATPQGQAGWSPDPYAALEGHDVQEEPHQRFVVTTPTSPDHAFHQFEYLIEPAGPGTTFTFIHSGNLGDDWSAPFDFEELTGYGWDLYMHTLQQYLTYFQNHTAVFVTAEA